MSGNAVISKRYAKVAIASSKRDFLMEIDKHKGLLKAAAALYQGRHVRSRVKPS